MEAWMSVHQVLTQEEWDETQPKTEPRDPWDAWHIAILDAQKILREVIHTHPCD
jgi:hypothetical protein